MKKHKKYEITLVQGTYRRVHSVSGQTHSVIDGRLKIIDEGSVVYEAAPGAWETVEIGDDEDYD